MKSYSLTTSIGNAKAGELDFLWAPTTQRRPATKYGVVLCHGSGNPYGYAMLPNQGSVALPVNFALAGIPSVAGEFGGQAWGSDTAMTAIDTAVTYMATKLGTPTDKVLLVGGSMGGYTAIRYALTRPTKVAGVIGLIPLTNMNYFYPQFALSGTSASEIASSWGVAAPRTSTDGSMTSGSTTFTSATLAFTAGDVGKFICTANTPVGTTIASYTSATSVEMSNPSSATATGVQTSVLTPLPAAADVQSLANTLTVPTRLYYSSADTLIRPADTTAFAAAASIPAINVGTHGHSEATIVDAMNVNGTDAAEIISYLETWGG